MYLTHRDTSNLKEYIAWLDFDWIDDILLTGLNWDRTKLNLIDHPLVGFDNFSIIVNFDLIFLCELCILRAQVCKLISWVN